MNQAQEVKAVTARESAKNTMQGFLILGVIFGVPALIGLFIYWAYFLACDFVEAVSTAPAWVLPVLALYLFLSPRRR